MTRLVEVVTRAHAVNPNICFEVFIHKVDGDLFLSDEHKIDCHRDIQQVGRRKEGWEKDGLACLLTLHRHHHYPLIHTSSSQRISSELRDAQLDHVEMSYFLTSIYDHSIFEAFSKVSPSSSRFVDDDEQQQQQRKRVMHQS